MKSSLIVLLSISACLILSTTASGGTFYVSPSGMDSNPGAQSQPWLTLQHAVDAIQPGDTILVESGTYVGCRIGNSGQPGAVCTLKADIGAQVLVNAPGPANKHGSNIEIENFDATVQYWVIDGFESANSPKYGIDIRVTDFITVQNCSVHDSALTGIFLAFSYHPTIQFNESFLNLEHGIYQSNSGDFPTIRGNKLHNNTNSGVHMNGDRNFTPGDGIISFALVEINVIYENGAGGGSGINCDGVSDSIIRNNLLYNNHASGISLYATDGAEGSSRNKVYNNTIVMAANSRWCVNIPASDQGQPNPSGNQIENNILYTPDSNHGSVLIYSTSVAGFISDYNVTVGRFSVDSGDSDMPVQSWQELGYDQHSIVAAPADLFVSQSGKDFHLKPGSPAIRVGAILPDVTDDLDGNGRPLATPYSIGCYEANTTVTKPAIDFTATPVHGIAPLTVNFTDETTGSPSAWSWDFGDGGKSTAQNPSHTYQSSGSYSVSLTASGTGFSGGKTRLNFITVGSPTGVFAPVSLTIVDGVLKAGDVSRVTAKDRSYLKVKSVPLGKDSGDVIQYDFQTGLSAASTSSISIVVIQHVAIAPQQEQISLFNFVTQVYDTVAMGTLTIPVDITTTVNLMNVAQYISTTGEIRLQVRMGDTGKAKFKHFVDQVQITSTSGM